MRPIRRMPLVLSAATVLALTACSSTGDKSDSAGSGFDAAATQHGTTVTIKNFAFGPKELHVKVGDTVTWTNRDDTTHTVTGAKGSTFDSDRLSRGKTYSMTFNTTGTFTYRCDIHQYMTAKIVVE